MQERKTFPSLPRTCIALTVVFLAMHTINFLRTFYAREFSPALSYTLAALQEIVCIGLPGMLWMRWGEDAQTAAAVRKGSLSPRRAAGIALLAVACVPLMQLVVALWCMMLSHLDIGYTLAGAVPQNEVARAIFFISAAVVAPVCEEMLFRGRLFAALEELGTRKAILGSTVFFALLHGQLSALPVHLLIGLLLALLMVRSWSLDAAILFHMVYNGATVALSYSGMGVSVLMLATSLLVVTMLLSQLLRAQEDAYILPPSRRIDDFSRGAMRVLLLLFLVPYLLQGVFA